MQASAIKLQNHYPLIILVLADLLFFGMFSPTQNVFVIVPAFVLVALTTYMAAKFGMAFITKIVPMSKKVSKLSTLLTTIAISLLVALQSIGQLTLRDIVTLLPLIALAYFYLAYTRSR